MGKKKTVTKNDPWAPAQPYILKNLQQQDDVFNAQQPELANYAKMQRDSYGKIAPGAEAGILSSQNLVNDTIGGKYLNGNPYLEGILAKTRENTSNAVSGQFSSAGRYGSGYHADILAKAIADAENEARYGNYQSERQNQINAVGQAQNLMGGSQSLLNNAAELPWLGVQAANGAVRQASSGYGKQTTTQSDPLGGLGTVAGLGMKAYTTFSDERLKKNKTLLGERPDGVGLYEYEMKGTGEPQIGVLAQDVAAKRPDALGPEVGGFKTVDYGALGMPGPIKPDGMNAPMPPAITQSLDMGGMLMGAVGGQRETPEAPKRGFKDKLDEFADYLLVATGNPLGQYGLQARAQARQSEADEAQYQRRQADEDVRWRSREDYKRANDAPQGSDFERMAASVYGVGTPEYIEAMRKRVDAMANPTQWITRGDGTTVPVPRAPSAPVGKLTPIGGQAATPPATF